MRIVYVLTVSINVQLDIPIIGKPSAFTIRQPLRCLRPNLGLLVRRWPSASGQTLSCAVAGGERFTYRLVSILPTFHLIQIRIFDFADI